MKKNRLIVIIGAGPSGTVAAAILRNHGHDVIIIEKQQFPRFSIGESLLCSCLDDLEKAGLLRAVQDACFQTKNGAAFRHNDKYSEFNFSEVFTQGKYSTYQVERKDFDHLLANEVIRLGVDIRFGHCVQAVNLQDKRHLTIESDKGERYTLNADFILDASGYGRVLPRLLDLEVPSQLITRRAIFTHIQDNFDDKPFDRKKILITTHATRKDIWFWTIPFKNGRSSIGVVVPEDFFQQNQTNSQDHLRDLINETPSLSHLLTGCIWDTAVNSLVGYSANVKSLHGHGFALLGNAAEFLDPVFSSGVTIAIRSATLAAELVHRELTGETIDWQSEYSQPLAIGMDCFRAYVENWYNGRFQDIVYYPNAKPEIKAKICSILAGYAWDKNNPFVTDPVRKLNTLADFCQNEKVTY